jgi:hypothetical protein
MEDFKLHPEQQPHKAAGKKGKILVLGLVLAVGGIAYTLSGTGLFKGFIGDVGHQEALEKAETQLANISDDVRFYDGLSTSTLPVTTNNLSGFEVVGENSVLFAAPKDNGDFVSLKAVSELSEDADNHGRVVVNLQDSLVKNTEITQYCVNFGEEGGAFTCETEALSGAGFDGILDHVYAEAGEYDIRIIVADANSLRDDDLIQFTLEAEDPVIVIPVPDPIPDPIPIPDPAVALACEVVAERQETNEVKYQANYENLPADETDIVWQWNFSDGTMDTPARSGITHQYPEAAEDVAYTASIKAFLEGSEIAQADCDGVVIEAEAPVPEPELACEVVAKDEATNQVKYRAIYENLPASEDEIVWEWVFSDDTVAAPAGPEINHQYPEAAEDIDYTALVKIFFEGAEIADAQCHEVRILADAQEPPEQLVCSVAAIDQATNEVTYKATSNNLPVDDADLDWEWYFSDATNDLDSGIITSHRYPRNAEDVSYGAKVVGKFEGEEVALAVCEDVVIEAGRDGDNFIPDPGPIVGPIVIPAPEPEPEREFDPAGLPFGGRFGGFANNVLAALENPNDDGPIRLNFAVAEPGSTVYFNADCLPGEEDLAIVPLTDEALAQLQPEPAAPVRVLPNEPLRLFDDDDDDDNGVILSGIDRLGGGLRINGAGVGGVQNNGVIALGEVNAIDPIPLRLLLNADDDVKAFLAAGNFGRGIALLDIFADENACPVVVEPPAAAEVSCNVDAFDPATGDTTYSARLANFDGDAANIVWEWEFPDGASEDNSFSQIDHTYADPGDYVAGVLVKNPDNTPIDEALCPEVTVPEPDAPEPVVAACNVDPAFGSTDDTFTFTPDGSTGPIAYGGWMFGVDGQIAMARYMPDDDAQQSASYRYNEAGTYTYSFTVFGEDENFTDTCEGDIQVFAPGQVPPSLVLPDAPDGNDPPSLNLPQTPAITQPTEGQVFDNFPRTTTISWTAVANAAKYQLSVDVNTTPDTDQENWEPVLDNQEVVDTFYLAQLPATDGPFRTRVRAVDADDAVGPYSEYVTFSWDLSDNPPGDGGLSVTLTSNPAAQTDDVTGRDTLNTTVDSVVEFIRDIQQTNVASLTWTWNYDRSVLDCTPTPNFDSDTLRCNVVGGGDTAVSVTLFAIMDDDSRREVTSNEIYTLAPQVAGRDGEDGEDGEDGDDSDDRKVYYTFDDPDLIDKTSRLTPHAERILLLPHSVVGLQSCLKEVQPVSFVDIENDFYAKPVLDEQSSTGYTGIYLPFLNQAIFEGYPVEGTEETDGTEDVDGDNIRDAEQREMRPFQPITRAEATKIILLSSCVVETLHDLGRLDDRPALYGDIRGHWAEEFINIASNMGWLEGLNRQFKPDNRITRAEFVKLITAIHLENTGEALHPFDPRHNPFIDVNPGDWYADWVQTAHDLGIIEGLGDRFGNVRFAPNRIETRVDAAVQLYNYFTIVHGESLSNLRTRRVR